MMTTLEDTKFEESDVHVPADEPTNATTPLDCARFFADLVCETTLSSAAYERMTVPLAEQKDTSMIPRYLPYGTDVAHKTGRLPTAVLDAGFLSVPNRDRPLVFSVFVDGVGGTEPETKGGTSGTSADAADAVAEIGDAVFSWLDEASSEFERIVQIGDVRLAIRVEAVDDDGFRAALGVDVLVTAEAHGDVSGEKEQVARTEFVAFDRLAHDPLLVRVARKDESVDPVRVTPIPNSRYLRSSCRPTRAPSRGTSVAIRRRPLGGGSGCPPNPSFDESSSPVRKTAVDSLSPSIAGGSAYTVFPPVVVSRATTAFMSWTCTSPRALSSTQPL